LKKILLTGGNGFISRSIIERLDERYNLTVTTRKDLDLTDSEQVKRFLQAGQYDVVLHTATYDAAPKGSPKDPSLVLQQNLSMFFNLANCDAEFGKMLYFGSGAEFSRPHWRPKMKESYFANNVPQDQYGFSKFIMNRHAESSRNIYNLRLFGVYGELDDWRYRFLSNICCHAVFGGPIIVNQNARVDLLYINDLIEIVTWSIDSDLNYHTYNVCSGNSYEYRVLAETIASISGVDDIIINNPAPAYVYSGNNEQLFNEMKSFDITPMKASLEKLYVWYKQSKHLIDQKSFHY